MNQARALFLWSCVALLTLTPGPARAQGSPAAAVDHSYVNVDGGVQSQSQTFTIPGQFAIYDETATFSATAKTKSGGLFNVEGGARVWRNLFIGVAYAYRLKTTSSSTVSASVPHPLFYDMPREASATASGVENTGYGVHISVGWRFDVARHMDVRIFGGPSVFGVTQDLVNSFDVQETGPPFSTVSLTNVTTTRETKTAAGFHVGLDGAYMITRSAGIGLLLRYGHGRVKLPTPAGGTVAIDAGGFDAGLGARIRF